MLWEAPYSVGGHARRIDMGTKNIAVSDEAYRRLKSFKKPSESFAELIGRLTQKRELLELAGTLTPQEGLSMKKTIEGIRKESSNRILRVESRPRASRQH